MANNHTCIVCGAEYKACDSCQKEQLFTPWRSITDTREHYLIYMAVKGFQSGITTATEAIEELKLLNVTKDNIGAFTDEAQTALKEIFKAEKLVEAKTSNKKGRKKRGEEKM